jgi:hypothetical protein
MYEYLDYIPEGNFRTLVQISVSEERSYFVELHVSTTTTVCEARQCEHVLFLRTALQRGISHIGTEEEVIRLIHAPVLGISPFAKEVRLTTFEDILTWFRKFLPVIANMSTNAHVTVINIMREMVNDPFSS